MKLRGLTSDNWNTAVRIQWPGFVGADTGHSSGVTCISVYDSQQTVGFQRTRFRLDITVLFSFSYQPISTVLLSSRCFWSRFTENVGLDGVGNLPDYALLTEFYGG